MAVILVVDDDAQLRRSFAKLLQSEGYEVVVAASGEKGIEAAQSRPFDLAVMDVRMPGMDGLEAFKAIQTIDPKLPVIIMTAYAATETAIEAARCGAFDFVLKPFDIPHVLELIRQALAAGRVMRSHVEMDADPALGKEDALLGRSKAMQDVFKAIGRTAPTDATVLVRGESGTGKELVARAVYQYSQRAEMPFLVINCVAIPDTLLESELFGYERGAFTGANARRVGKVEQAGGGTLFLDEIGDMPQSIQAKILRLLQEKTIERLGGRNPVEVDVRIIAATNRNLEEAIQDGRFREDLYYRLNVVSLNLPPLRERLEDVDYLADHFLARFSRELGVVNPGISEGARRALAAHSWPGNVRELANVIHKALIFSRGYPVSTNEISTALDDGQSRDEADPSRALRTDTTDPLREWIRSELTSAPRDNLFEDLRDRFGAVLIEEALDITGGNRSQAARLLGVSRPTLLARIDKYGVLKRAR
ncbi:MAG: sigma-54-dependent transcriptional regulator [Desulfovibrio sp.]|uniref:sigma-54-dependent transcriptional regulator n=1 Tax=Desulfovibrio sp. 7SRBS1 TaxID=3378064 RepID=UPI003B3F8F3A